MNSRILTGLMVLGLAVASVLYIWQPWTDETAIKLEIGRAHV